MRLTKKPEDGAAILAAMKKSDKGAFLNAVKEVVKDGGGKLSIMRRENVNAPAGELAQVPMADVVVDDNFFETVRGKYKDGLYTFKLWNGENESVHSEHHFALGDISPKKKKKKGGGGKGWKGQQNFYAAMMEQNTQLAIARENQQTEILKSLLQERGNNGGVDLKDVLLMQQQSFDRVIQMQQTMFQTIQAMMGQGGSTIEEAAALIELMQRLQPQQQEEGWAQLLPILASLRGGGGLSPQLLQEFQALKQNVQNLVSGAAAGAPGAITQQPPAPGASASGGGLGGAALSPDSATSPTPPSREGTQEYFTERFVRPFQMDVANNEKDDALAYQIVSMIFHARDRMADNPPPLVADFLTADTPVLYEAALQKFFGAIPELANLTQKQIAIRTVLLLEFLPLFQESEAEEVQEAHPIIHIDEDQVVEEASIHDADRESVGEAASAEGTGDADLGASAPDNSELQHEAVPSEVG